VCTTRPGGSSPLLFRSFCHVSDAVCVKNRKHFDRFPKNRSPQTLSDANMQTTMGHASRNSSRKRSPSTRQKRTAPPNPVAKRRRKPLSAEILRKLDHFKRKCRVPLRVFCTFNDIPYTAAYYHLNHSSAADRERRNAKIIKIVKRMSKKTRVKFQSVRISAADVIEKLGDEAGGLTTSQVNRIIKQALTSRPKRQRMTGQPNAASTPDQMRSICAQQVHF